MSAVDSDEAKPDGLSTQQQSGADDDWEIGCSDDEKYCGEDEDLKGIYWHPPPQDVIRLYGLLSEKGMVDLEWECPGRRSPSPLPADDSESDKEEKESDEEKPVTEFDFDDIFTENPTPKITPRRATGMSNKTLKGSGQKRVASFKNVMFDIRRHQQLEKAPKQKLGRSDHKKKAAKAGGT